MKVFLQTYVHVLLHTSRVGARGVLRMVQPRTNNQNLKFWGNVVQEAQTSSYVNLATTQPNVLR